MRLLVACCFLIAAFAARADIVDIDNAALAKLTAAGVPLVDIRTASEWQETGIVPGSHLLTFFDERGNADPAAWLKKVNAIAKPGDPVIVICRSGNRTQKVSKFLSEQARYAKVYNVRNGFNAWAKEHRPIASAAPALAACQKARTC
ncbi:MAG TPA: rhodanese-like domain-containing protein [Burkholderiales bacterium]|nr:rhodanese-like domain-containing protein [Burkholderiales bacterium]